MKSLKEQTNPQAQPREARQEKTVTLGHKNIK